MMSIPLALLQTQTPGILSLMTGEAGEMSSLRVPCCAFVNSCR